MAKRTGRQRSRDEQQRGQRASVRMNADEYEAIAARATAAGMTVPSYLVAAGMEMDMQWRSAGPGAGKQPTPQLSPAQRKGFATEVLGLSRTIRSAGNNLNQLTRYAHTERRRPDELPQALDEIRAVAARLIEFLDDMRPILGMRPPTLERRRAELAAFVTETSNHDEPSPGEGEQHPVDMEAEALAAAEQYDADNHEP